MRNVSDKTRRLEVQVVRETITIDQPGVVLGASHRLESIFAMRSHASFVGIEYSSGSLRRSLTAHTNRHRSAPGSGVSAAAKPLDCRVREDAFNASAQARRGFALALPDRLEHGEHIIGFNRIDRHFADDRIGVIQKALPPIVTVSLASQTLEPIGHIVFRHFLEGGRRIPLRRRRDDCLRAHMLDRINSVVHQRTRRASLASSLDEAHIGERAEPYVARAVIQPVSVNPGSCSTRPDLQTQTAAIICRPTLASVRIFASVSCWISRAMKFSALWVTHVPPRPYASR